MKLNLTFRKQPTLSAKMFKRVDVKCGKGFCEAVKRNVVSPTTAMKCVDTMAREAYGTATHLGLKGPMRVNGKYDYQTKCDMYIGLVGKVAEKYVSEEELHEFQEDNLYCIADSGVFMPMNYVQFVTHLSQLYRILPVKKELREKYRADLERCVWDPVVQKDMKKFWTA